MVIALPQKWKENISPEICVHCMLIPENCPSVNWVLSSLRGEGFTLGGFTEIHENIDNIRGSSLYYLDWVFPIFCRRLASGDERYNRFITL